MSLNILVSKMATTGAINQAKVANGLIDTGKEHWEKQGESSVALEAFSQQFDELQRIISEYKTLLDGDLNAASQAVNEMFMADLHAGSLWR